MDKSELTTTEEELREALEGKKLKEITLPQNSNDIDQGSDSSNAKVGQKSSQAWYDYVRERDQKMKFGDKQAIFEYMQEASEIRQRLEAQKQRSLEEYYLRQEEKSRLAKEARITSEDRKAEAEDIQKLEGKRDRKINDIHDYFNSPEEEWQEYLNDRHTAQESLARVLIARTDNGVAYCCGLHRYKYGTCSAFTIEPIEQHFREYEPEKHKAAIIDTINEKYDKLVQERIEQTLEDKNITLAKEIRQIEKIHTRVDGDMRVTKLTKGQKARLREREELEQAENKRIYSGLYS